MIAPLYSEVVEALSPLALTLEEKDELRYYLHSAIDPSWLTGKGDWRRWLRSSCVELMLKLAPLNEWNRIIEGSHPHYTMESEIGTGRDRLVVALVELSKGEVHPSAMESHWQTALVESGGSEQLAIALLTEFAQRELEPRVSYLD